MSRGGRVEAPVVDDDAAEHGPLPGEELARRVHDDRRAVFDRPEEVGGRERAVDDERDTALGADRRDGGDVEHVVAGVRERFGEERLGPRRDGGAPRGEVVGVDEGPLDAQTREVVEEEAAGALVDVLGHDDVVAGIQESEERDRDRRLPAGDEDRLVASLEGREALLNRLHRRVPGPGVPEAAPGGEVRGGLVEVGEGEPGGQVDGRRPGRGGGDRRSHVHLTGREPGVFLRAHAALSFQRRGDRLARRSTRRPTVRRRVTRRGPFARWYRGDVRIAGLLLSGRDETLF